MEPEVKHFNEAGPDDDSVYLPGNAPGAFHEDARVRKCMCERGDAHRLGAEGRVVASIGIPQGFEAVEVEIVDPPLGKIKVKPRYIYAVIFDGDRQVVHVGSHKLEEVK